jgi:hypothetical protein
MLLLVTGWMRSTAQFLGGFFDQGATQLQLDGQQLAALQAYTGALESGYRIVENGISDMGAAKGGEYGLHQGYFASLAAVNPSVMGMPEVQEILTVQEAIVISLSGALDRWQSARELTSGELDALTGLYETINQQGQQVIKSLTDLVTADRLTMTDDQRIAGIQRLDMETKQEYGQVQDIVAQTDLIVQQRQEEQGDGNAIGQFYQFP